nr:MAG TPA: hypothetical protein [Caudoviricetes sp.]
MIQSICTQQTRRRTVRFKSHSRLNRTFRYFELFGYFTLKCQTDFNYFFFFFHILLLFNCYS